MKTLKIVLICAAAVAANLPRLAAEAAAEKAESKSTDDTGYLFRNIEKSGGGGGLMVMYGTGPDLKDSTLVGGRGFVLLASRVRVGGLGMGFARPGNVSQDHNGGGFGGLFGEYLLRFDPVMIGLGLTMGGGGGHFGSGNPAVAGGMQRTTYGYFLAYPMVEVEIRVFEHVSLSVITGYAALMGASGAPNMSQYAIGLGITFGKF